MEENPAPVDMDNFSYMVQDSTINNQYAVMPFDSVNLSSYGH